LSEKEFKVIHANVYDPKNNFFKSHKNDKSKCSIIMCNNSENCELFSVGTCMRNTILGFERCPFGKNSSTEGFTYRAKKYNGWIKEQKEKYKDIPFLKDPNRKMAIVGNYIYLPYAHITMNESIPFLAHGGFMRTGLPLLEKSLFNINTIINIISFTPIAMMGGAITSYHTEVMPVFVKHLSETYPELYFELIQKLPDLKVSENYDYIGREAVLSTLNKSFIHEYKYTSSNRVETWIWNGEYFTIKDYSSLGLPISGKIEETRLYPKEGAIYKVQNNNQVNENTEFVN